MNNITKGEGYAVSPFMNNRFGVSIMRVFVILNLIYRTCSCKVWKMSRIPCEHACAIIPSIEQNMAVC